MIARSLLCGLKDVSTCFYALMCTCNGLLGSFKNIPIKLFYFISVQLLWETGWLVGSSGCILVSC